MGRHHAHNIVVARAKLPGSNLKGATFVDVITEAAIWNNTTCPDGTVTTNYPCKVQTN